MANTPIMIKSRGLKTFESSRGFSFANEYTSPCGTTTRPPAPETISPPRAPIAAISDSIVRTRISGDEGMEGEIESPGSILTILTCFTHMRSYPSRIPARALFLKKLAEFQRAWCRFGRLVGTSGSGHSPPERVNRGSLKIKARAVLSKALYARSRLRG